MLLIIAGLFFVVLLIIGFPIAFSLGLSGIIGLVLGNYKLILLPINIIAGADSFILLAIPSFIFAGALMERCGISYRLVDFARAMVGWFRGGLGMSAIGAEIMFSGVSGSSIADVSAIGSIMIPPMIKAGYKPEHAVSIVASATGMGILIPPAIFMIVIGTMTQTSVVGVFLGAIFPGLVMALVLMLLLYFQARRLGWPVDTRPSFRAFWRSLWNASLALVVPLIIIGGFRFGIFTATEAGAICAFYALLVALVFYRNVSFREIIKLVLDSAVTTAAVVLLLGTANLYAFLLGKAGVPAAVNDALIPIYGLPWLFLIIIAAIAMFFGMIMEGLPGAVIMLPVIFPTAQAIGLNPIHFCVVITAAVGVGLFLPPTGVGLLMAVKFGNVSLQKQMAVYLPYIVALLVGLLIVILFPELSLFLPRGAGFGN